MIERHKTAIKRNKLSRPINLLLQHNLLTPESSFFDYGCGHGEDLTILKQNNFENIAGFDPHFFPNNDIVSADIVNLGYVLNVIEKPLERKETLLKAFTLAKKAICISVMTPEQKGYEGELYADGVKTSRGTFQKYFEQAEIKNYIESITNFDAISLQPGIFLVFKNEMDKLSFLDNRRTINSLLSLNNRIPREDIIDKVRNSEYFPDLFNFISKHGRMPSHEELPVLSILVSLTSSMRKFLNVIDLCLDKESLNETITQRKNQLLVMFALRRFDRKGFPKKASLPKSLLMDIEAFFPSFKEFLSESEKMLFSLGNEALMRKISSKLEIGKVLPDAIYIHPSYISSLPPEIQIKVGIAQSLAGDIDECNLIKINKMKEKVSFLAYEDFDEEEHPALLYSYSVDIPKNHIEFWDFTSRENPPILHRKETFVGPDYPHYEMFKKLTEAEDEAGLLSNNTIGTLVKWYELLNEKGYEIVDHQLLKLTN